MEQNFLFVKINPREGAALEVSVTLLWKLELALAKTWRHNTLLLTGGAHLSRACR